MDFLKSEKHILIRFMDFLKSEKHILIRSLVTNEYHGELSLRTSDRSGWQQDITAVA